MLLRCFVLLALLPIGTRPLLSQIPNTEEYALWGYPGKEWKLVSNPVLFGWDKNKLAAARSFADSIGSACVMIIQGGLVIDQWGDTRHKYNSYSIRKSLASALYGIYSARGVIRLDQTLAELDIDDNPPGLTPEERSATIRHLLGARSGIYHPVDFESQTMKDFRPARGSHSPGSFWFYNNWDFNVLGTILEQKTSTPIGKSFYKELAQPLGMQDYEPEDCYYISGPVSMHRAFQFRISSRDLARLGLLYLRQGRWTDRQVIPSDWIQQSSNADEMVVYRNQPSGGYANLWWVEKEGTMYPGVPKEMRLFAARGLGEHALIVIPCRNLVIVHRVANADTAPTDPRDAYAPVTPAELGQLLKKILDAQTIR